MKQYFTLFLIFISAFAFSQKADSTVVTKKNKNINFAVIPIVSYNKSFGGQVGVMANMYYNLNKNDTISPVSVVGLMGTYFYNGTYFAGVFATNYFNEDRWRTKIMFFNGNIEFQTYINYPDIFVPYFEEDGFFMDYTTNFKFVLLEGKRQIVKHLYLGARVSYSHVTTEFATELIPKQVDDLVGIGIASEYDTRDKIMNPKKGMNAKFETFSFLKLLGSSTQYHKIQMQFNKYFPLTKNSLIMARFMGVLSVGDVPFSGKNIIGRDDLRGYSNGKYRANQVYNIQTEYRWNFYKKWGLVAFGGLAIATDNFKGDNYSGVLPAIGTGFRFMAIPSRGINVGMDVATGKEDWGLYFRIGEVFTR